MMDTSDANQKLRTFDCAGRMFVEYNKSRYINEYKSPEEGPENPPSASHLSQA